ncbi:MAG: hypothetical protein Q4D05_07435, partial [Acinetobacter sp.]|nr:hypothetical protein [Acinetobacter sp.]
FGRSDLATNLIFAVGFALLFFYLNANYTEQVMSYFGISLNIINLAFVFYIGFSSALSIHLSKGMNYNHALFIPVLNRFIFTFVIKSLMISLLFSPIFIGLYFGEFSYFYLLVVCLSLFIAAFDGLSVAFIARLRVMGYVKYPPLFRLLLIFIGMPLAIYLLPMLGVVGILIAFASINFIIAMSLFLINRRIYHLKS